MLTQWRASLDAYFPRLLISDGPSPSLAVDMKLFVQIDILCFTVDKHHCTSDLAYALEEEVPCRVS